MGCVDGMVKSDAQGMVPRIAQKKGPKKDSGAVKGYLTGDLLWVGLGNPGPDYQHNRHNFGFLSLDRLADRLAVVGVSPRQGFHGRVLRLTSQELLRVRLLPPSSEVSSLETLSLPNLVFLWPNTFMNRSGLSVAEAMRFYKIPPAKITVFHDEIELPLGSVRVKTGGGVAGHNGLRDIDRAIGRNFRRVRLGVGRPPKVIDQAGHERELPVDRHVLSDFTHQEAVIADALVDAVAAYWNLLIQVDQENLFMTKVAADMAKRTGKEKARGV